jgi:peptidoglycan/xylan/chitin deacetylase (PgdA/CDA1 family)
MKSRFIAILAFLAVFPVWGISFNDLILSNDDRLLFRTDFENQQTLFISRLTDLSMQQLTAFPEKLEVVNNGRTILAHSRFGTARIPAAGGLPSPVPGFPSFATGTVPLKGRAQSYAASADGRWLLYVEPVSPAFGKLLLIEMTSGTKWTVCEKIELPSVDFPARWSPDSRLFVYAKGDRLFYYPILSDLNVMADERFRQIGPGGITSVLWGQHGDFYYFTGNTLYRVINPELFTRTIYGDFLSIGEVAATLPFNFEPGFDRYWIAPGSGSLLVNKRNKSLFFFMLGEQQFNNSTLPHIMLPQGAGNISVLWSSTGQRMPEQLTIISSLQNEIKVWRYEINEKEITSVKTASVPSSSNGLVSGDGARAIFWGERGLELWDYTAWRPIARLSDTPVLSCAWLGSREILAGNARFIESINVNGNTDFTRRIICLSGSVEQYGFEDGRSNRILARMGTDWFVTDGRNGWTPAANPQLQNVFLSSDRFRIFLEPQSTGPFKNIPMIRNTIAVGTVPLISNHSSSAAYTQGRPMQIALCFDLYDDDTGVSQVLNTLRRYNIRATFFMNGDFIRRNPTAAAAIAQAGHETASLFYAPIDLSDSRYQVSAQYIAQGLARNEDEFFRATGKELSLLWHPPFYRSSPLINSAAAAAGYTTASRSADFGDWISRDEALRLGLRQLSASNIIEQIIEKKSHGAVIPVRLGLNSGGRDDYLYQRIDVLLDALLRSGCEIVPVSAVIRR